MMPLVTRPFGNMLFGTLVTTLGPPQLVAPQLVAPQLGPPQLGPPQLVPPQLVAPQLVATAGQLVPQRYQSGPSAMPSAGSVTCSVQLCRQRSERSARSAMSSSSHTMGNSLTWYRHVMADQSTQL